MLHMPRSCLALALGLALLPLAHAAQARAFDVTPLVTDDPSANPAQITDAGLVNAWGLAYTPTGPFWLSANGAGTSPLYRVASLTQVTTKLGLTVAIPGDGSVTGQVYNSTGASAFHGDTFLFASEDGTVSGWRGALGGNAETLVAASSANVYKGLAFADIGGNGYAYGANFRTGTIDVIKGNATEANLPGSFVDPNLPSGYAPFNIQNLGGTLYATYAKQDATGHDDVAGAGFGFVDRFDVRGHFLGRVASGGPLNSPWGLALAPSSFGALSGALLVGNFGDGHINAFDPLTHRYLGAVSGADGNPLAIDGLWALAVGNDAGAGNSQLLYYTAGPNGESHGVFGVLTPVPEPSTYALMLAGLIVVRVSARRVAARRA